MNLVKFIVIFIYWITFRSVLTGLMVTSIFLVVSFQFTPKERNISMNAEYVTTCPPQLVIFIQPRKPKLTPFHIQVRACTDTFSFADITTVLLSNRFIFSVWSSGLIEWRRPGRGQRKFIILGDLDGHCMIKGDGGDFLSLFAGFHCQNTQLVPASFMI